MTRTSAATSFFVVEPIVPVVLHCLEARGIERRSILRRWGVTPGQLASRRLPVVQGYRLWSALWALAGRDFALELARFMSIGDVGLYDYLWRNSPNLGQAITVGGRFARLLGDDLDVTLRLDGDRAMYCYADWRPPAINEAAARLVDVVRRLITTHLAEGDGLSATDVARGLDLSVATLRRQLRDHDTSFSALRDQVRKEVALARLPDTTVSDVAALTGCSDHSAFCKAFRRWTGMSPSAFRDRHERDEQDHDHPGDDRCAA